jgi:nucleotide-binding universal stress UspA family protein
MAYKDLLLQISSYPEATPSEGVKQAVGLAELLDARLTALTFEIDVSAPSNSLVNAILDVPAMVAAARAKSVANARELLSAFNDLTAKHNVACENILEHRMTSQLPRIVTEYARLRDLTLIPIDEAGGLQQYIAETVIFGSGRPVLVYPAVPQREVATRLDVVSIAWDFSRPAARAVADAIPILKRARAVRAVTFTNEKTIDTSRSGSDLARHLACHGIEVTFETESAAGRPIGEVLAAYARSHRLDLLVMGAYGHSRIRDFILGGATKSVMANPPVPVLLSH